MLAAMDECRAGPACPAGESTALKVIGAPRCASRVRVTRATSVYKVGRRRDRTQKGKAEMRLSEPLKCGSGSP